MFIDDKIVCLLLYKGCDFYERIFQIGGIVFNIENKWFRMS